MKKIIPIVVGILFVSQLTAFAAEPVSKGDISEFSGSITNINVRDYGATPNDGISDYTAITQALNYALSLSSSSQPVSLTFDAGTYNLANSDTSDIYFFSRSGPDKKLWIKGNGTVLVSSSINKGFFQFEDFNKVLISGVTLDLETQPNSVSRIDSINTSNNSIDVTWLADSKSLAPNASAFSETSSNYGFFLDSGSQHANLKGKILNNSNITSAVSDVTALGNNRYRVKFPQSRLIQGVTQGGLFFRTARVNGSTSIRLHANHTAYVKDVTIHASSAGTFNCAGNHSLTFENITVNPGQGRYYATNADGFHLKTNRRIYIDNAYMESIGDDMLNMSQSSAVNVLEWLSSSSIKVRYNSGLNAYQVGDQVHFFDSINAEILARRQITAISRVDNTVTLSFNGDIPSSFGQSDDIWMQNFSFEGAVIKNSSFLKSRRHGLLIRHPNVLITNNNIKFNSGNGIAINTENGTDGNFSEGYIGHHVDITNNLFERNSFNAGMLAADYETPGQIALYIQGNNALSENKVIYVVNILQNTFKNWVSQAISVTSARNITIDDNQFDTRVSAGYITQRNIVGVDAVNNVKVRNNSSINDIKPNLPFVGTTSLSTSITENSNTISR
ncbi:hypothetical protein [Shewanella sp. GXUN23E]|uniref:hypothetical protein n=1 Tax=Shewanella sp. GXUN23E TaxID=3422498 RepID=UPI003D7DA03C